jgi:hypothetical protein
VSIVWVDMLPDDTEAGTGESARIIDDPRVRHFHDPAKRSGRAVAASLGWKDYVAWDIYLFYEAGSGGSTGRQRRPTSRISCLGTPPTSARAMTCCANSTKR